MSSKRNNNYFRKNMIGGLILISFVFRVVFASDINISCYNKITSLGIGMLNDEHLKVCNSSMVKYIKLPLKDIIYNDIVNNITTKSNVTSKQLKCALNKNLMKYSEYFIQAEKDTGINAIALASIAACESNWGESDVAIKNNNIFGWIGSNGKYMRFNTVQDCIKHVSSAIKNNYLDKNGMHYNGNSISDINIKYNGFIQWEESVDGIIYDIVNNIYE